MRVTEIFESIQGETTRAGLPCAFVRFTGCDLRCIYCDSSHAYAGGEVMTRAEVVERLGRLRCRWVTLTGGEPLLQPELPDLCRELLAEGWEVSVETHGQAPLDALPEGVARVIDVKTPGSGHPDLALLGLESLRPGDEVKFVLCSEADFVWSLELIRRRGLEGKVPILLSPAEGWVSPRELVRWMLAAGVRARLNLQLHKVVWGPDARGV